MSWVSNVMLSVESMDQVNAEEFNEWIAERCPTRDSNAKRGGHGRLSLITGANTQWGGYKYPECDVYAGALNHADLDALVTRFGAVPWLSPNAAQLFILDQARAYFRLWMIRDGVPQQYAPSAPDDMDDQFYPDDRHKFGA